MKSKKITLEAVSYQKNWPNFQPKQEYSAVIIDDNISLKSNSIVKSLICSTDHFIFVGPQAFEAEEDADWTISETSRKFPVTSSSSTESAQEIMELVNIPHNKNGNNLIIYLYDETCIRSKILLASLKEELNLYNG